MKILESQNATLTNYEVYTHLLESNRRFSSRLRKDHRRPPKNYQVVTKDVIQYCETHPSPLSQDPRPYKPESISVVVERLADYGFSKGEMVMIINLRPTDLPSLHVCVEELGERYSDGQQAKILQIVVEVLGRFPPANSEGELQGNEETEEGRQHEGQLEESIEK